MIMPLRFRVLMIMIENQSISKKQKMDYHHSAGDLLSDLPLSIIHTILALAPVRDAIKTSILSRQWRYTWTSLPHLVFEECSGSRNYRLKSKFEERMRNLITHVLFHHKGPIHKFKISVSFQVFLPHIDKWVLRLSRKDIRELILDMGYSDDCNWLQLHSSIYSCEKLIYLNLFRCEMDPPPSTFKGFLSLRHLCLQEVHISSNRIESFLANSPLLEKLVLIKSRIPELRISAPNLKHLYLVGEFVELCLYAPLLAEMDVELTHDDFTAKYQQRKIVCNYTNFIGGFTHLEKLRGHRYFTKYLSIGIESYHHSLLFPRLNDIGLEHVNFEDIKVISVVARLIISAPNLQTLEISTNVCTSQDDASEAPRVSFRDFGCAPNFAFEKLRVANIDGVCGLPAKSTFIKFLLGSSPMLEMMTLDIYGGIPSEKKLNLIDELLAFPLASPNAKLLINVR